ncbi:MAG TPA: hypothetical protein VFQ45_17225 [Longimicrobium sp.]|nr:hypothetical protein [Longimicrobium sp.]
MSTKRRWACVAALALVSAYAWIQGFATSFGHALLGVFVRDASPWRDTWVGVVFHAAIIQLTLAALAAVRLGPQTRAFRLGAVGVAALPPLFLLAGLVARPEYDAGLAALLVAMLVYRFGVQQPAGAARPLYLAWAACAALPLASAVWWAAAAVEVAAPVAAAFALVLWLGAAVLRLDDMPAPAAEVAPAA